MISNDVYKYCGDDVSLIENYDEAIADSTQTWHCHHRAEILPCGDFTPEELKKFDLYFNRPASELIFLLKKEHFRIHSKQKRLHKQISITRKANGKPWHSKETRIHISEATKGKRLGNKNAVGGKGHTGLKWITNGTDEKAIPIGEDPPTGWRFGRKKGLILGRKKRKATD